MKQSTKTETNPEKETTPFKSWIIFTTLTVIYAVCAVILYFIILSLTLN